jgi:hypothetical protein
MQHEHNVAFAPEQRHQSVQPAVFGIQKRVVVALGTAGDDVDE